MIDIDELKGAIIASGHKNLGKAGIVIGIKPATFYRKLRNGDFTMNEIDDMVISFHIRHPEEIFRIGVR